MSNPGKDFDLLLYNQQLYKRLTRSLSNQFEKVVSSASQEYTGLLKTKVEGVFATAVKRFYDSYTPKHNKRTNAMYDLLYVDIGDQQVTLGFDPTKMNGWRVGKYPVGGFYTSEHGLYEQAFVKGWHGGAGSISEDKVSDSTYGPHPDPGTPYWGRYTGGGWTWGSPAPVAKRSPLEEINRELDKYPTKEDKEVLRQLIREGIRNFKLPYGWWR